jgi:UDP-N-acetylmuramoylalanine--D-glutamate ligase
MKKIVILGAGESGAGSAILAQRKGFDVFGRSEAKIP